MPSKTVIVGSAAGLHARSAALIASAASEFDARVQIATMGGDFVDASSTLGVMTLGAGEGSKVIITSEDAAAVEKIAALVERDLGS